MSQLQSTGASNPLLYKLRETVNGELHGTQWLRLVIFGNAKVGFIQEQGWKGKLPLYAFICHKHGLQYTYPSGHYDLLICPICQAEMGR